LIDKENKMKKIDLTKKLMEIKSAKPPKDFSDDSRKFWNEKIGAILESKNRIAVYLWEYDLFADYCNTWCEVVRKKGDHKPHEMLHKKISSLGDKLGYSPLAIAAARAKLAKQGTTLYL
jgi:hypothetical protein